MSALFPACGRHEDELPTFTEKINTSSTHARRPISCWERSHVAVSLAIDPTIIDCPQGQAASWLILGPQVGWCLKWLIRNNTDEKWSYGPEKETSIVVAGCQCVFTQKTTTEMTNLLYSEHVVHSHHIHTGGGGALHVEPQLPWDRLIEALHRICAIHIGARQSG